MAMSRTGGLVVAPAWGGRQRFDPLVNLQAALAGNGGGRLQQVLRSGAVLHPTVRS